MFLESPRFPTDLSFQKPGGPTFNADVQVLESGFEQRNQFWPESRREFDVGYGVRKLDLVQNVYDYFESVGGMEHGFRIRDWRAWKSVRITSAGPQSVVKDPVSALDQVISVDTTTQDVFQLIYTARQGVFARKKSITKPVDGTVSIAIQGITIPTNRWDLLYVPTALAREGHETIGRVTLAANVQKSISSITNAASAVVQTSTAHGLSIGDSVNFSGVSGMTQINGKRGLITAVGDTTHFTVAIDSSAFSAYTSAGTINTQRQSFAFNVSVNGITNKPFATVTSSSPHGLIAGDIGVFSGVTGMTELNGVTAVVRQVIDSTTFRIDQNAVEWGVYGGGGTFAVAERVTAGYEYDLPVRFNTNSFPMQFEAWEAGAVSLNVIELRII